MKWIRLDVLLICLSIICAAAIIGYCIINSVAIINETIRAKKTGISEEGISEIIKGLKDTQLQPRQAAERRPEPGSKKVEGVNAAGNAIKGSPDAKVLMVEFSDFQCPFSKRFYQNAFLRIEKEYISTGKVKFAYRDFPLGFHPQAKSAAVAAKCAGRQNKYWEMFDKLINAPELETESLKGLAKEIGLNAKVFDACLDREETKEEVENDLKDAQRFGVQGTPAFFINGRMVEGAMPFELFKKIIEEELAKTK
ncbi:MAG: DsbA family protein [Candidatus Omnitrophica bacterium]|nr:DsbA family protein [Candidatus Omnitrophota bacterium]